MSASPTHGQTTENQIGEIKAAGFDVHARRVVSETVSGSVATKEREGFPRLLDRMEEGDILVVTKMDRLGRNAMDVRTTVETLAEWAEGSLPGAGRCGPYQLDRPYDDERHQRGRRVRARSPDRAHHAGLIRAKEQGKVLGRRAA